LQHRQAINLPKTMNEQLSTLREYEVRIPCRGAELRGDVAIPVGATGLVIFAHGSGSSRLSPRNRMVANEMHQQGLATLLFDLLTASEAVAEQRSGELRFDIPLLTDRLVAAIHRAQQDKNLKNLGIGLFGASTGAAAALCAAARIPEIQAVVSRGGRTDLAGNAVHRVLVPTLLIVGENDKPVMKWNEETLHRLPALRHLAKITDATHLFEEPGALEEVSTTASAWFKHYLSATP
jgi:putative phosphoribosyl transferase